MPTSGSNSNDNVRDLREQRTRETDPARQADLDRRIADAERQSGPAADPSQPGTAQQ